MTRHQKTHLALKQAHRDLEQAGQNTHELPRRGGVPIAEPAGWRPKEAVTGVDQLGDVQRRSRRREVSAGEGHAVLAEVGLPIGIGVEPDALDKHRVSTSSVRPRGAGS